MLGISYLDRKSENVKFNPEVKMSWNLGDGSSSRQKKCMNGIPISKSIFCTKIRGSKLGNKKFPNSSSYLHPRDLGNSGTPFWPSWETILSHSVKHIIYLNHSNRGEKTAIQHSSGVGKESFPTPTPLYTVWQKLHFSFPAYLRPLFFSHNHFFTVVCSL